VYAGRASGNWDIYLQRVGGQNATNLTADSTVDDTQPAFSPDGNFIAFRSERENGSLMVMGATGESPRHLTNFGYNPSWSPDGKQLTFATESVSDSPYDRIGSSTLWVANVVSGKTTELAAAKGVEPSWSPHGDRIAYWASNNSQIDIWTIRPDGKDPQPVTNDSALDWSPQWSPDGRYLYFSSDRGGSLNLYRLPIDERSGKALGVPESVTTGGGQSFRAHPSISKDGRQIAYVEEVVVSDTIQKVDFDPVQGKITGSPSRLTADTRAARHADPSPDGQWLTYMTWGAQEDIFAIHPDGSGQKQLTNDSYKDRVPRWSPDGSRIVFYSNRSGNNELWAINPDGSGLEQLTHYGNQSVIRGIWSPDARRMVSKFYMKNPFLLELNNDGKIQTEKPLPPMPRPDAVFDAWSWSPDGRWLAGTKTHVPSGVELGVGIFNFGTQQYEDLTDFGMLPIWLPDSRRLLFESRGTVYLVDRVSKNANKVFSLPPDTIYNLGQLPRDGRTLYFGVLTRESDIWLMTLQ
jgi:Tol biopolymer transport system component